MPHSMKLGRNLGCKEAQSRPVRRLVRGLEAWSGVVAMLTDSHTIRSKVIEDFFRLCLTP